MSLQNISLVFLLLLLPNFLEAQNPQSGTYSHQVYMARSPDSLEWKKHDQLLVDHASVPDAVIRDGVIFLYFNDSSSMPKLSVGLSRDLGKTWVKTVFSLSDGKFQGVDPNPVVLSDGRIRLFYYDGFVPGGDPASLPGNHDIRSIISEDGTSFIREEGVRFSHPRITDPDVVKTADGWKMFTSMGRTAVMASSDDGLNFKIDPAFASTTGAVSKTIAVDGGYRLFKCVAGGIASQFTQDFKSWKEEGMRLTSAPGTMICDPSIIQLPDKSYLMFYKSAPSRF